MINKINDKIIIRFKFFLAFLFFNGIIIVKYKPKSALKVLICTVAKQENKYIKEFVEHYEKLKFEKIIIYDNNDLNGENFNKILRNEIKNKFIEIIDYRGLSQPQESALNDCYNKNKMNYDWIAFYDIDEFLYIRKYSDINQFLSLGKFKKCQSIIINWKYFGDNDKLYYESKPLSKRFIYPLDIAKINIDSKHLFFSAAKTIVRGRLNITWGHLPHYINNTKNCRPSGKILKNYFSPPQLSKAWLSHYITKSTEEFIQRLKRGDVLLKPNLHYIKNRIDNYYFAFNKFTVEKSELFKKKLNLT